MVAIEGFVMTIASASMRRPSDVTMPVGVMTRRSAGRVGPDDLLDQVVIDGDLALAARILENQSYTV